MRNFQSYTIWDAVTPQTLTSSTNASPTVLTKTSHGYVTGDRIIINGHTTNTVVNGYWEVVKVDANTFRIRDVNTQVEVNGTGVGADGVMALAPKILLVEDFRNVILQVNTTGSLNATVKVAGSIGKNLGDTTAHGDTPNFGATISPTNPYSYVQIINLDTAAAVNGATGITSAGTDLNNTYEVNTNGIKYLTVVPTAWTAGVLTITAQLFDEQ